jgi:regulator of protease activity HflC (stomatin/prohibitin superfamily)
VTVTVDAVVYYRICIFYFKKRVNLSIYNNIYCSLVDPVQSVNKVANVQYSTRLLAATSLRNILGTKTLQEILTDKVCMLKFFYFSYVVIKFIFLY